MEKKILIEFSKSELTTIDAVIKNLAQSNGLEHYSARHSYFGKVLEPICEVYVHKVHIFSVQARYDKLSEKQQFTISGPALAGGFDKDEIISKGVEINYWKSLRQASFEFMEDRDQ